MWKDGTSKCMYIDEYLGSKLINKDTSLNQGPKPHSIKNKIVWPFVLLTPTISDCELKKQQVMKAHPNALNKQMI